MTLSDSESPNPSENANRCNHDIPIPVALAKATSGHSTKMLVVGTAGKIHLARQMRHSHAAPRRFFVHVHDHCIASHRHISCLIKKKVLSQGRTETCEEGSIKEVEASEDRPSNANDENGVDHRVSQDIDDEHVDVTAKHLTQLLRSS